MQKRILAAMLALVLLIPAGMAMVVSRYFQLTLARERDRALNEEAAIARAVYAETNSMGRDELFTFATSIAPRYDNASLHVTMLYYGQPMANDTISQAVQASSLLQVSGRATLLLGDERRLYIMHQLNNEVSLLVASDVSGIYELRNTMVLWVVVLCGIGAAAALVFSVIVSSRLTKPMKKLVSAAEAMSQGDYDAAIPQSAKAEVGVLAESFEHMRDAIARREAQLVEQDEQKQQFIDAMAHEMRTPLTTVLSGARLLAQGNLPQEQQAELAEMMAAEALRLSNMDERLMLLTKMNHGELRMTDFSAMQMIQDAIGLWDDVQLSGTDTTFTGERELLIEVVRNLVTNAKRAGGTEPVCVSLLPDGFAVIDHGCGMTSEQAAHIFEPFYRVDKSRARKAGGAGLGLTLCHRIAELHHAALCVDSAPGEGTTMTFRFAGEK